MIANSNYRCVVCFLCQNFVTVDFDDDTLLIEIINSNIGIIGSLP
jgi:hypothetical protein